MRTAHTRAASPQVIEKSPSNWYFGWNIVAAASLLTLLTVGMRMGIGPFFLPMAEDLGFSRSLLAGIVAVGMLCYGLGMPLAAHLVARYGTRFVLLLGTVLVVASAIWTVMARSPASFLLAFGVLMSIGLAFTGPVALTPVISRWFSRQRGMALFFLSTGAMAGIAVMTPVFAFAIESVGWQTTLLGFAGAFTVVTVPIALFVIRDTAPPHADLVGTHWELYAAATIGGIVWAGSIALSSAILADVYGLRLVGILYGWAYLGHQIGGMISSWLGGWGYETFGTHWVAFGAAGALLLVAASVSLKLPPKGFTLMAPALVAGR
jgi:MFS family permease